MSLCPTAVPTFEHGLDLPADPYVAFWSARPALAHIHTFARARRAGPWAVLIAVLARATAATEPNLRLPPAIGRAASLNLFCALVGPSGGGKGAAEGAAAEAVTFTGVSGRPIDIAELPIGSGEGIARTFLPTADGEQVTRALFSAPEVDTLAALGSRQGATIMGELRKVFMGEQIGFANANKATRTPVPAHTYRVALLVGVQPLRARALFDDADGGTPQRFVWMPVSDPDAPDERPAAPEPLLVRVTQYSAPNVEMPIPQIARDAIDAQRLAVLRGEAADPLDSHKFLTRLKVAAALAVLAERAEVIAEDWTLAATIIRVSDATRDGVLNTIADHTRSEARTRAEFRAALDGFGEDRAEDRARTRVRGAVVRCLKRRGSTRRDLRNNLKAELRHLLNEELAALEEAKQITNNGGIYTLNDATAEPETRGVGPESYNKTPGHAVGPESYMGTTESYEGEDSRVTPAVGPLVADVGPGRSHVGPESYGLTSGNDVGPESYAPEVESALDIMVRLRADGLSIPKIAARLNETGVKPPLADKWSTRMVEKRLHRARGKAAQ